MLNQLSLPFPLFKLPVIPSTWIQIGKKDNFSWMSLRCHKFHVSFYTIVFPRTLSSVLDFVRANKYFLYGWMSKHILFILKYSLPPMFLLSMIGTTQSRKLQTWKSCLTITPISKQSSGPASTCDIYIRNLHHILRPCCIHLSSSFLHYWYKLFDLSSINTSCKPPP